MRKSILVIVSLLVVASMLFSGCASKPKELSGVLNVWSFTNEIKTMAIAFQGVHPGVKVTYTMIPASSRLSSEVMSPII